MAWTRVQGVFPNDSGAPQATTITCTLGATVTSGNAVLGIISWDANIIPGITLTSVTDDKGNSYNLETTVLNSIDGEYYAAYSRTNITNGPKTLTATYSGNASYASISAEEFSGGSTASTDERDGHTGQYLTSAVGTGTDAYTSGNITTTVNGDLIWSAIGSQAFASSPATGTGFTSGGGMQNNIRVNTEYLTQSTAGTTAGTWTESPTAGGCSVFVIALKPTGGAADVLAAQIWL